MMDSAQAAKGETIMTHPSQNSSRLAGRKHQEGMALVLALMVLLLLTVIGAALMANVNTETKIAGLKVRSVQASTIAEAGVQEAMLRLRNGDVPDDLNPRNVTIIYNQVAGSLPTSGTDTTSLATLQPAGSYLNYSTATKSWGMLTLKYKTKAGVIQRYDDAATPKINGSTGNPIWIIKSTGMSGNTSDSVYAEVTRAKITVLAKGAVVADVGIAFKGNIKVCGHDHRMDTPLMMGPPTCDDGTHWSGTVHGTCMPGAWSQNAVTQQGSPTVQGEPSNTKSNQTGFYSGPWDVFNMTQSDFWTWIGAPRAAAPANPIGIYYLDNDATKQNGSGSWSYNGGNGEGLLYCDGDLSLNGNFTYKGLIYVEGDLSINGNCWLLGGLVVKGKSTVHIANGSAIVLYSGDAISQKVSKYGGNLRTIAWREM